MKNEELRMKTQSRYSTRCLQPRACESSASGTYEPTQAHSPKSLLPLWRSDKEFNQIIVQVIEQQMLKPPAIASIGQITVGDEKGIGLAGILRFQANFHPDPVWCRFSRKIKQWVLILTQLGANFFQAAQIRGRG